MKIVNILVLSIACSTNGLQAMDSASSKESYPLFIYNPNKDGRNKEIDNQLSMILAENGLVGDRLNLSIIRSCIHEICPTY